MAARSKAFTYERGIEQLEALIAQLEDGEVDLDKSLALYEQGVELAARLNKLLDEARARIDILEENGEPQAERADD